jgi:hypothetical protein
MRLLSLFSLHFFVVSLALALPARVMALDADAVPVETLAGQQLEMLKGAQVYFEEVNLRGGIHGRPIHVATAPNSSLPGGDLPFSLGGKVSYGGELPGNALGPDGLYELRPGFDAQVSRMVDHLFELNAKGSSVIDYRWVFGKPLPTTPLATGSQYGRLREYQDAMKAAGYPALSAWGLEGYINAKVVVEGLRRAGRTVVSSLDSSRNYDLGGIAVAVGNRPKQTVRLALNTLGL